MAKLCSVPLWVTSRKPLGYGLCGALGGSDWGAMQDPLQQKPPCRSAPMSSSRCRFCLAGVFQRMTADEKQTEGCQGAFVWRTFCRFCLGSGFSLALVDRVCTGNKINVTPAPFNLSLLFLPPPPFSLLLRFHRKRLGRGERCWIMCLTDGSLGGREII